MSAAEYAAIKDSATFRRPAVYDSNFKTLAPCLSDSFEEKLRRRGYRILSQVTVTATCLNVYKAKQVVKQDDKGRFWLLVGDAAMAVPYFRALNDGLLAGSLVAKKVIESLSPGSSLYPSKNSILPLLIPVTLNLANRVYRGFKSMVSHTDPLYEYGLWFDLLSYYESYTANVKTTLIDLSHYSGSVKTTTVKTTKVNSPHAPVTNTNNNNLANNVVTTTVSDDEDDEDDKRIAMANYNYLYGE